MKLNRSALIIVCGLLYAASGLDPFQLVRTGLAQTTAIVGGTVIDGTGASAVPDAVILINGKKITAVGKKVEVVNYPDGRFVVQLNGTAAASTG